PVGSTRTVLVPSRCRRLSFPRQYADAAREQLTVWPVLAVSEPVSTENAGAPGRVERISSRNGDVKGAAPPTIRRFRPTYRALCPGMLNPDEDIHCAGATTQHVNLAVVLLPVNEEGLVGRDSV